MAWDPIAYHSCKRPRLQIETAILPRRNAQCVFVEPNLCAAVARIESAVDPRLRKEINLRPDLRIQKECQTRVEKSVNLAVDEAGRRLFEVIDFQIERAAQSCAQIILKCRDRERAIEPV